MTTLALCIDTISREQWLRQITIDELSGVDTTSWMEMSCPSCCIILSGTRKIAFHRNRTEDIRSQVDWNELKFESAKQFSVF
jgi:hypothetical protein